MPSSTAGFRRGDTTYVVGIVAVAHFISHVYLLVFPPLFPILGREFDLTTTELGLLVTAIYVPTLLFQLLVGEFVDRLGARRILVAGTAVTALGVTLAGFATAYPLLLACAFLSGIGQSVFHPADYALLDTVTDKTNEGQAFSVHTFGGFAGFAAAPVLVGGIALTATWQLALISVGVIGFLYAGVVHLTVDPVHTRSVQTHGEDSTESVSETLRSLWVFARQFEMLLVGGFYLLSMSAIVGLQSFTTVLAVDTFGFDDATANNLLTAHLVATAIGVISGGPLADRLPFRSVLAATFLLAAVSVWLLVTAITPTVWPVVILLSAVGLFIGLALPSRDKFGNAVADEDAVGKSFGFYFTGLSLGAVISPALLGAVIDWSSASVAFLLVGVFLLTAVGVIAIARLRNVGTHTSPAET